MKDSKSNKSVMPVIGDLNRNCASGPRPGIIPELA